jgi:hypothetical protein
MEGRAPLPSLGSPEDLGRAGAIAVVTIAIALLQELLILAFQVVLENDAVDVRAFVPEAFGFLGVGAIEFCVMLQFARLGTPA